MMVSKDALNSDVKAQVSTISSMLVGGGEMGKLVRSKDWAETPLGPIESWPQSLRTTVSLCMNSNFPICLAWGAEHTMIYNDGYWPICGEKHPRSMGQSFPECWADVWPLVGEAYERALAGETQFFENMQCFINRYGFLEEIFCTFSYSPIRDETGKVIGIFHPVTEHTDKTLAERRTQTLRELAIRTGHAKTAEEVFTLAAEALGICSLDLPFVVFYRLDAKGHFAQRIASTGLALDSILCPDLIDMTASTPWPLAEALHSGQGVSVDLEKIFGAVPCGPYPEPPTTAFVLPIGLPGSERSGAFLIAGLSSRLPENEAYRNFLDLVVTTVSAAVANASAYEQERRRAEALAEIDKAKTLFFSNISHEFRTPLTLMLGPIEEALQDAGTIPDNRVRMEVAHRNALRLLKLVNNLLDFSRIEAGRVQASYRPTDLSALTAELASMFRSAVEKAGLRLIVTCPTLPQPVYVDRDMWEKVVLNLLSNAFKHTFKGEIEVRLQWTCNHAELIVRDTGVGISAEQLPKLFDRFYRVPNARSRTHEGSGIGLALVHELVKLHGGQITINSAVDQGTVFTVSIPAGKEHLPADRIEAEATLESTALGAQPFVQEALRWLPDPGNLAQKDPAISDATGAVNRRGPRILLADDNPDMRDYVARLLIPYYDVEAVPDGKAALLSARHRPPDLILSDIMMPNMDGLALLQALRDDDSLRTIPLILLSARAGEEARIEGVQAGADDYLTKPFSAKELLTRVKTNLELSRVRHEELVRQLEKQVQERTIQLEAANRELESFAYSVSHDLRAPLRAIDGFSQAVLERYSESLDTSGQELLRDIRQGSQRMGKLIDAILSLSRLSREQLTIETDVNLSDMALEITRELQVLEPERMVTVDIEPGLVVTGDKRLLQSVLQNLLGNAWKYSAKHPTARIQFGQIRKDGVPVYFTKDDGAGFNMAYAGKLFGAFQRLHNETEFPGTGVGLATAARIIHRHEGEIWAEGTPEKGATFYFTLEPIALNQEQANGRR